MWVGEKNPRAKDVLDRNGLFNGDNYVLKGDVHSSEVTFQSGSADFRWVKLPEEAKQDTDVELETRVDALGAFGFIRTEDGTPSKSRSGEAFFVSTGGFPGNELGRVYKLRTLADDRVRLTILQNADTIVAAGGDTAVSPDDIDINDRGQLMGQEDGTAQSRVVMAAKGRDGSIWSFQTEDSSLSPQRVAQLDPPGRDGAPVGPGIWETSGIIDASDAFGPGAWLLDVQAHAPDRRSRAVHGRGRPARHPARSARPVTGTCGMLVRARRKAWPPRTSRRSLHGETPCDLRRCPASRGGRAEIHDAALEHAPFGVAELSGAGSKVLRRGGPCAERSDVRGPGGSVAVEVASASASGFA